MKCILLFFVKYFHGLLVFREIFSCDCWFFVRYACIVCSDLEPSDLQAVVAMTPALRSKLNELEQEIERFRKENTELAKLKKEREGNAESLDSIIIKS